MGVSFLFLLTVTVVATLTSNIPNGLNVCSSDVSLSGQVPSQEQAPAHTGGQAAGSPAGRLGSIPLLYFTTTPTASQPQFVSFPIVGPKALQKKFESQVLIPMSKTQKMRAFQGRN